MGAIRINNRENIRREGSTMAKFFKLTQAKSMKRIKL
jgi:hypothetical protein